METEPREDFRTTVTPVGIYGANTHISDKTKTISARIRPYRCRPSKNQRRDVNGPMSRQRNTRTTTATNSKMIDGFWPGRLMTERRNMRSQIELEVKWGRISIFGMERRRTTDDKETGSGPDRGGHRSLENVFVKKELLARSN